jgi:phage shock protein A
MAIITRLARLWRADINALLDRLEAPDLVLAQAVREMEQHIDGERRLLARLTEDSERLAALEAGCRATLEQTAAALEDCLSEDRDDLARPLIRRRLEAEQQRQQIERRRKRLAGECEQARRRIAEREVRLADLRARASLVQDAIPEPEPEREGAPLATASAIRDEDVEIALLQAKRLHGGAA